MRLFSCFFACPHPRRWGADVADDSLASFGDVDMLDGHLLSARIGARPGSQWLVFAQNRLVKKTRSQKT